VFGVDGVRGARVAARPAERAGVDVQRAPAVVRDRPDRSGGRDDDEDER
jgi:hypothetical protein